MSYVPFECCYHNKQSCQIAYMVDVGNDMIIVFMNTECFVCIIKNRRAQVPCACRSLGLALPVHLGPIDGHMRCPIIKFFKKKINFAKFVDIHTYGRTGKSDF